MVAVSEAGVSGVVFVAEVFVADVAEPQAFVDNAVAFHVRVPVSAFAVEVDSSGHPISFALPDIDYCTRSSSSVEALGEESVDSSTGAYKQCLSRPEHPDRLSLLSLLFGGGLLEAREGEDGRWGILSWRNFKEIYFLALLSL